MGKTPRPYQTTPKQTMKAPLLATKKFDMAAALLNRPFATSHVR